MDDVPPKKTTNSTIKMSYVPSSKGFKRTVPQNDSLPQCHCLACFSLVGKLTLALMLLFDNFADLLQSLNSFSHWTAASPCLFSGNFVFAMLSFSCSLPSPVTLLLDLFVHLLCSLDFFSGQVVTSLYLFSSNVVFAVLLLSPFIPSLVTIPFDLFADLPHSG